MAQDSDSGETWCRLQDSAPWAEAGGVEATVSQRQAAPEAPILNQVRASCAPARVSVPQAAVFMNQLSRNSGWRCSIAAKSPPQMRT